MEAGPPPAVSEGAADAVRGPASGAAEAASGAVDAAKDAFGQTAASSAKALSGVRLLLMRKQYFAWFEPKWYGCILATLRHFRLFAD